MESQLCLMLNFGRQTRLSESVTNPRGRFRNGYLPLGNGRPSPSFWVEMFNIDTNVHYWR